MKLSTCIATLLSASLLLRVDASRDEASDNPEVRTPLGAFRGTTMTSRSGRTIYAFRGMRYAKPPVGELRFKKDFTLVWEVTRDFHRVRFSNSKSPIKTSAEMELGNLTRWKSRVTFHNSILPESLRSSLHPPVPLTQIWDGIKNATENGASCLQASDSLSGPTSEDCLFLNVYSTKLPDSNINPQQPVLVFLHHGGWYEMSSQSSLLGPQYLMDQDIVLVTINNRLGALGFLSTGDSEVPGNNGLKDQLQALKWVHDNIASFGGDPNLVTIYGYSAGAASVQYHMASPRSAGLFHRAISSSGSALSSWAITRDPMALTRRQAKLLNCPNAENATSKQIVDCLRDKDAEEIAKSYFGLREWQYDPLVIFAPVIEKEGSSDAPFITEDPYWLFRSGNFSQVPWLTGSTNNEWMRRAKQILDNDTVLADLSQNFERVAPILFYYERDTPSSQRKSRKLHDFYFPEGITKDSLQEITDLYTDGAFLYGVDTSVKMISSVSRSPVYYYQFVYRGRFGHMSTEPGMDKPPGAVHHDDLIYVFYPKDIFPFFEDDFPEAVVSKRLVKMWANFARTGNPTPVSKNGSELQMDVSWTPLTPSDLSYLEIGEESVMKISLRQERAAIWEEYIYPKPRSAAGNRYSRRGIH